MLATNVGLVTLASAPVHARTQAPVRVESGHQRVTVSVIDLTTHEEGARARGPPPPWCQGTTTYLRWVKDGYPQEV